MEETTENKHEQSNAELKEFARTLVDAREAANMTIEDVAAQSGGELKIGTIKALEKGRKQANIRNLVVYARTICVKIIAIPTDRPTDRPTATDRPTDRPTATDRPKQKQCLILNSYQHGREI